MLDESEFKPYTLNDFSTADDESENTENTSTPSEISTISSESNDAEVSERNASFKPLTFEVEEVSEDFILNKSNNSLEVKTDTEKIQMSEEFKSSEFFLENSLLTNAEEFAETIREGAKLHKDQLLKKIEEQANDTDLIHQKTVADNQAAEQQRKKLLSETENKVHQIKEQAHKEGFEAGRIQGMQQRYDETKSLAQQVNNILEQLDSLRKVVRFQAEEELVKLALQISKNIVAEEIKLNKDVIKNIVQAALNETEVHGKIYLYLHPDNYEFLLKSETELERYLSEEQNLVIRQNPDMQVGSINVESDEEIISRSIEKQFKLIEDNLNEQIENRQAHLHEVDIDAHDFNRKPDQRSHSEKIESTASQKLNISSESSIEEQDEKETTSEEFIETEKNDDTQKLESEDEVIKEDSVLKDEPLKHVEESNNISLEGTEAETDSNENSHSEQISLTAETETTEQENESSEPTESRINIEGKKV